HHRSAVAGRSEGGDRRGHPVHQHEHGDDWTAYLSPRARPAGDVTLVATVAVDATGLCPDLRTSHTVAAAADADLSLLGVLRV
ncbi:hypothetical protein AB0C29_35010, partial [Actinoplanes sp. NPDC048791]|uniref:hypothetical protein n=1 Tax=Actinoplanes sp. NPDC048791 TaxID=3154623 RepID=UPI0033EB2D47